MFVLLDFQESQRSLLPQACKGFRVVNLSIKLSRGLRFYVGCLGYKMGRFFSHLSFISKSDLFIFSFSLLVVVAKPFERRVIQRGQRISAFGSWMIKEVPWADRPILNRVPKRRSSERQFHTLASWMIESERAGQTGSNSSLDNSQQIKITSFKFTIW